MTSLKVAETLKELRHHRGFTQKQLSEQLHISRQAYSNYENGTRLPDLETACVIADYFQISLDQLVRVGLHPEKPADPFASLPKDMQDFLKKKARMDKFNKAKNKSQKNKNQEDRQI